MSGHVATHKSFYGGLFELFMVICDTVKAAVGPDMAGSLRWVIFRTYNNLYEKRLHVSFCRINIGLI